MWPPSDVDQSRRYRVALCQSPTGARTHALHPEDQEKLPENAVFLTAVVSTELLMRRDFRAISNAVKLIDGQGYWVDAHGVWFTLEEVEALEGDDDAEAPWVNGLPALVAPK